MGAQILNKAGCADEMGIFSPSTAQRRQAGELPILRHEKGGSRRGLFTMSEAAAYLRISAATLRRLEKVGKIRYCPIGRKHFFTIEDLESFLARSACGPGTEECGYDCN